MSGDGPPPLPHGDDPWELLAVERGADERELKRAYARRIKVYRPDRSPVEFARIQAAYEQLQHVAQFRARMAAQPETETETETERPPPRPPREPRAVHARDAVAAMSAALETGDSAAAAKAWAESKLSLTDAFAAASPEVRDWLVRRERVTWRALTASSHSELAAEIWIAALRVRLAGDGTHLELDAMIEDPALLADVAHDELAAAVALRAVSALAWHSERAHRLFRRLKDIPHHPWLDALRDRALLDLDLGDTVRALPPHNPLVVPPQLRRLLCEGPLLDPQARAAAEKALYDDLDENLGEWVGWVRGLYQSHPVFAGALTERLLDSVPFHRRLLGALPRPIRRRIGAELKGVRAPAPLLWPAVVVGVAVFLVLSLVASDDTSSLAFWGAGALVAAAYYGERALYRRRVRIPLIRVLIALGVTRAALHEWLGTFMGRAFRLAAFRIYMSRDSEMRILAFLAAATHPGDRGEGVEDDGDLDERDHDDDANDERDSLVDEEDPDAPRGPVRRFFDWFNNLPFVR